MKRFLLLAALVLPMMVVMTGCSKESAFIGTWVYQGHVIQNGATMKTEIKLNIQEGYDCNMDVSVTEPTMNLSVSVKYSGSWILIDSENISVALTAPDGSKANGNFRKQGKNALVDDDGLIYNKL